MFHRALQSAFFIVAQSLGLCGVDLYIAQFGRRMFLSLSNSARAIESGRSNLVSNALITSDGLAFAIKGGKAACSVNVCELECDPVVVRSVEKLVAGLIVGGGACLCDVVSPPSLRVSFSLGFHIVVGTAAYFYGCGNLLRFQPGFDFLVVCWCFYFGG
ncbi:hypothetical protein EVAR_82328_1 [Eumeta japonica]|uniref:Uncharacterized protein n=1 Tax=Eumeta variegata TaxID=151549 RepID=A0A4C1U9S8_EUMVA|nr:hypothetical protein EVAR_82328_1 [Eumeta japonica]